MNFAQFAQFQPLTTSISKHKPAQKVSGARFRSIYSLILCVAFYFCNSTLVRAEPNQLGQTGTIYMPDARIERSGTLRFGYSYFEPYPTLWSSISLFSRLEFTARYTRLMHVTAFEGQGFGDSKDKSFDTKLMLVKEGKYWPELSVGAQDFLGTQLFEAEYAAINKQIWELDFSAGYGWNRIDGWFGGVRYTPSWTKYFNFVAEYDAFDYKNDPYSEQSGAALKPGGLTLAAEVKWGWLGAQVSYQEDDFWGASGYVSIPLDNKEFIPKLDEPPPDTKPVYRPTIEEWQQNEQFQKDLVRALEAQGNKNVRVRFREAVLEVGYSNPRITFMGRATGRSVRTAMLMSPLGTQSIKLTYYSDTDLPVMTYHFKDLKQLDEFFRGTVTYGELIKNLSVSYADPKYTNNLQKETTLLKPPEGSGKYQFGRNDEGHAISLKKEGTDLSSFQIIPLGLNIYFNDPSGAFRYDFFATAKYRRQLGQSLFLNSSIRMTWSENVSGVTQPSNSTLPHVRTDIALYKRESRLFKLNDLFINKFFTLKPRIYARYTLGYYEEMYGGTGGQVLYLPKEGNWAVDVSVDWLKKREFQGGLGFQAYETVTALTAFHYQFKKYGVTFTMRAGRFLAKDEGARFELSRTFRSGARVGGWYTYTNGNDITPPGSPGDPYFDKGIFFSIPLNALLTKDTKAKGKFSLAPWTRDVGQMVKSPGDLYEIMEGPLTLNRPGEHILSDFHQ